MRGKGGHCLRSKRRTAGWLSAGRGTRQSFKKSVSSRDQASSTNGWIRQVLPITVLKSRWISTSPSSHACLLPKLRRSSSYVLLYSSSLLTEFPRQRVKLARGLWQVSMRPESIKTQRNSNILEIKWTLRAPSPPVFPHPRPHHHEYLFAHQILLLKLSSCQKLSLYYFSEFSLEEGTIFAWILPGIL